MIVALLMVLAVLATAWGMLMFTTATIGVGLVGVGAVLAILARVLQADQHHRSKP